MKRKGIRRSLFSTAREELLRDVSGSRELCSRFLRWCKGRGGERWIEEGGGVGEEKVKDLGWAICMMGVWICAV